MTKKYALIGGPGTGKSTLLAELQKRGIYAMKEVAEYLIERELRKENGILPWKNRDGFQKKLLETQLKWEREIPREIKISFQDRGIADGIAYYRIDNLEPPKELLEAARNANYETIFLLDPLKNYKQTEIRHEDKEKALRIHNEIRKAYEELGYKTIRIPAGSLEFRIELILDLIKFEHDAMKQPEMDTIGGRK